MSLVTKAAYILKRYGNIISDEECKELKSMVDPKELKEAIMLTEGPYNYRQIEVLMDDGEDPEDESVIGKYAQFIKNYQYTYNDKALSIDPSIDTNKEHIGPMAQDIEKVNPACIEEDPKTGYKTVDTGRLALMNAGAIAELARKVEELHG